MHLSADALLSTQLTRACECSKKCNNNVTDVNVIRRIRQDMLCNNENEHDVTCTLVERLKGTGGQLQLTVGLNTFKVCSTYYANVHAVGKKKVKTALRMSKSPGRVPPRNTVVEKKNPKFLISFAF